MLCTRSGVTYLRGTCAAFSISKDGASELGRSIRAVSGPSIPGC